MNTRTLDIGIDLDGVCYDFHGTLRRFLHGQGRPLDSMPPPVRWEFYLDWGLTTAEFVAACDAAVDGGALFWRGQTWPETDWALATLVAEGHRLHFVTDRTFGAPGVAKQATKTWLERRGFPVTSLWITAAKASVPCDVFLDDRCENYDAIKAAGGNPYLFARPWNDHHDGRSVSTWQEFIDVVRRTRA